MRHVFGRRGEFGALVGEFEFLLDGTDFGELLLNGLDFLQERLL
jgi:hypothetical protein